ncbi:MAG: hypothetical protein IJ404_05690 [Clostridia bacterium]|nr:hypothetical protein [Clostridia bacterium]
MAVASTVQHFQRTVWSASILRSLDTITSLRKHCNFQYEKDTKNAKEVKILGVTRPTIHTYVSGTPLERESAGDTSQTLVLDQFKYFNFEVEDIDRAQSQNGLMEALTDEASKGLALEGDKYVAEVVKQAADAGEISVSASVITLTNSNAMASVEEGFATLYEHNCSVHDAFYLEVAPRVFTTYRQQLTELSTNNPEILKKGAVGKINNAYVCIENCLAEADGAYYNILRTEKAVAFAEQIESVEAYRPEDAFTDAVKGLYVFGAKIVRPEEIYVMKTKK